MRILRILKTVSTALLLVALAFPLYRLIGNAYVFEFFVAAVSSLKERSCSGIFIPAFLILAYSWPVPFAILDLASRWRNRRAWVLLLQVSFCVGSMLILNWANTLGALRLGGYLAFAAFAVHFAMATAELVAIAVGAAKRHRGDREQGERDTSAR